MMRNRDEGDSYEHIFDSAMGCAKRICSKRHTGTRGPIQEKLYEFLRNRIDAAVIGIISDRALNYASGKWTQFSSIERRLILSVLGDLYQELEIQYTDIKSALGSS